VNPTNLITPEEAKAKGDTRSLEELRGLAESESQCENCDEPAWRFGGLGMCFTCTTGESDGSGDYELAPSDLTQSQPGRTAGEVKEKTT